jgi:hypothetical protein
MSVDHRAVAAELRRRPAETATVKDNLIQMRDRDGRNIGPQLTTWDFHVVWDFDGDEAFAAVVEGARMAEERQGGAA